MFRYLTALFVATLILAPLSYSTSLALAATEDWPQMGDDIVGTSSNTETGKSVAISDDGSIIAEGSWELTAPGPVTRLDAHSARPAIRSEALRTWSKSAGSSVSTSRSKPSW